MEEVALKEKNVKKLFIARACLWACALAATVYWMVWSFKIYLEITADFHEYATILRPKLYAGIIIAVICILISFRLRKASDILKKEIEDIIRKRNPEKSRMDE